MAGGEKNSQGKERRRQRTRKRWQSAVLMIETKKACEGDKGSRGGQGKHTLTLSTRRPCYYTFYGLVVASDTKEKSGIPYVGTVFGI